MASIVEIIIKAADQTKSGFTSANKNLTDVEKNLARIAPAAKAAAVAAAAAVAVMVKQSIDMADEMSKAAQKIGLTTEGLSKLKYAAEDLSGVQGFDGAMAKLNRTLVEAATLGGRQAEAFKRAGIAMRDASGNIRQSEAVLLDIADVMQAMPDSAEKTALAMEFFGKSGAEMIPFLNGGSEAIREMTDKAKALGLEISTKTAEEAEEFNDNLTDIAGGARGVANGIAAEMLPVLVELSASMVKWITENGIVQATAMTLSQIIKGLTTVVYGAYTGFKIASEALAGGMAAAIAIVYANVKSVIDIFSIWGRALGETIHAVWEMIKALGEVGTVLGKFSAGDFTGAMESAKAAVAKFGDESQNIIAAFTNATKDSKNAVIGNYSEAWNTAKESTKNAIADIIKQSNSFYEVMQKLWVSTQGPEGKPKAPIAEGSADRLKSAQDNTQKIQELEEQMAASLLEGVEKQKAAEDARYKKRLAEIEKLGTDSATYWQLQTAAYAEHKKLVGDIDQKAAEDEAALEVQRNERRRQQEEELRQLAADRDIEKLEGWEREFAIEEENHLRRLAQIDELGLGEDEYYKAREAAEAAHQSRIKRLKKDEADYEKQLFNARLGFTAQYLGQAASLAASFGKKGLMAYKVLATGEAIIATYLAANKAFAEGGGWPLGAVFAAITVAQGLANVAKIKSVQPAGQAHAGMDYVPSEGSYVLQRGEMVLDPGTSESVRQAARSATGAQAGGNSGASSGGSGGFMGDVYLDGQKVGRWFRKAAQDGIVTLPKMAIV